MAPLIEALRRNLRRSSDPQGRCFVSYSLAYPDASMRGMRSLLDSEVTITLPGGAELVSVITNVSAQTLKLKKGKKVYAVVKASNIILGVD